MATFVLIHGAADTAWYWHLVEPELSERGHDVVTMDLPCDDYSAGLAEYADTVVDAIGDRKDLVLVAQSFGGFTAPLVCERVPVDLMVLVAAMIPSPGEAPNDYWTNTGYQSAKLDDVEQPEGMSREDAETIAVFMHDVPADLAAQALNRVRDQSETSGTKPWPLAAWPDVPTRFFDLSRRSLLSRRLDTSSREGTAGNQPRRDRRESLHCSQSPQGTCGSARVIPDGAMRADREGAEKCPQECTSRWRARRVRDSNDPSA